VWRVNPFEVKDLSSKLESFFFVPWCLGGESFFGTLQ
jgi:hypothetical protein